jgi:hypothetical protein
MPDIVIRRTLDSDTLHLPELKPLVGKAVEIIVRERPPMPADLPEKWRPLWEIGGLDLIDPDAVRALREASRTDADPGVGG